MIPDNRAQSIGISRLFLALGVGFVMVMIVNQTTQPMFALIGQPDAIATNGTSWLNELIANLPLAYALISLFGLVAYSVFRRQVIG